MKSKFIDKKNVSSIWNNLFHYILYSTDGLLVKCLNNLMKYFEKILREDSLKLELKSEKDLTRRFVYFVEIINKYLSPKMLKVNLIY
jgi:hypothetical protein